MTNDKFEMINGNDFSGPGSDGNTQHGGGYWVSLNLGEVACPYRTERGSAGC
jgi:hypothetical protein